MSYILSIIIYAVMCLGFTGWMCILPLYMAVFEFSIRGWSKRLFYTFPYFLISGFCVWLSRQAVVSRLAEVKAMNLFTHLTLDRNPFFQINHSICGNLYQCLIPNHLTLYHEPIILSYNNTIWEGVLVACILCCLPSIYRNSKGLFFGVCIFLVNLFPTFTVQGLAWLCADRYNYIGSIAVACLIACGYGIVGKWGNRAMAALLCLFLAYFGVTVARNCDYATNHQFWMSTVKASPFSPRAHSEMGRILLAEGNYRMAIVEFNNSVLCSPEYDIAWANLGIAYVYEKNYDKAVESFEKCVSMKSPLYMPYMQVGIIYLNSDMFDKAILRFHQAHFRCRDKIVLKDLNKAWHITRRLKRALLHK